MIWYMILISLVLVLSATTLIFVGISMKATTRINNLEYLFLDTLEDIEHSASIFDTLVNRRSLLSDDPDVQKIRQVFAVTLNILGEYISNGKLATAKAATEKEREEQEEE